MGGRFTVDDMRKLAIRRIVVTSVLFAAWIIGLLVLYVRNGITDEFIGGSTFMTAIVLVALWVVSLIRGIELMRDDKKMKAAVIARNDERNVFIAYRATRLTMAIVLCGAAFSLIILSFLNMDQVANIVGYIVCGVLVVYLVCWKIIERRS